ncbi:hypothetical protein P7C70_g175, partial [Phenoliferia sp. Uapishka_3]
MSATRTQRRSSSQVYEEDPSSSLGRLNLEPESDVHSSDDDFQSDDEGGSSAPRFTFPTSPPQIDSLSLPSPIFGRSFVDLLSPLPPAPTPSTSQGVGGPSTSRPPSRLRTTSAISRNGVAERSSEMTLNFSNPRPEADVRVRKVGRKDEEPFISMFPDEQLEYGGSNPEDWRSEDWADLERFLKKRGYKVDGPAGRNNIPAVRESDSLALHLQLVPIDDISYELDVLEHLASAGVRSSAKSHGILATVPTIGIVPLSEEWTAVLTERWEALDCVEPASFPTFAKDIIGSVSFLHSNHIAHLSLSPDSIAHSPASNRWTLTSFISAIQGDPLAKRPLRVTGAPLQDTPAGYSAPEQSDEVPYDPFAADSFSLGKILLSVAVVSGVDTKPLKALLDGLSDVDPKLRTRPSAALACLKVLYP